MKTLNQFPNRQNLIVLKKIIFSCIEHLIMLSLIFSISCKETYDIPTLNTVDVTLVTQNSASCGVIIVSDGGTAIKTNGVCWSTGENPNIANKRTIDLTGVSSFTSNLTKLSPGTTYFVRAYATNSEGIGYGNVLSFTTLKDLVFGSLTDVEGNVYKTIQIGNQVWLAENLQATLFNDSTPIPNVNGTSEWLSLKSPAYCWYAYNPSSKKTLGALYNWYAVNTGKLCPTGWHVPTDTDWHILSLFLDPSSVLGTTESYIAGGKMKVPNTSFWILENAGATNESGFSALGCGSIDGSGVPSYLGVLGSWWSATEADSGSGWGRSLNYEYPVLNRSGYLKEYGCSLRCIKN